MTGLLLDSFAAIWLTQDEPVSASAAAAIDDAARTGTPVYVSPVTAWQIGQLAAAGHLAMAMPPIDWFSALLKIPGVTLAALTPEILIASSYLPGSPPEAPAARLLAATARANRLQLVTRDAALLDYAKQGHVRVVEC
jgi:PIN domain nuclease of toxin-antitoxin system